MLFGDVVAAEVAGGCVGCRYNERNQKGAGRIYRWRCYGDVAAVVVALGVGPHGGRREIHSK